jgi:hypothetical protein
VEPERSRADRAGEFGGRLPRASEREPAAGRRLGRMPQLAARGDLKSVSVPGHDAKHRGIGIRLDGVENLDPAGDGGPDPGYVRGKPVQVVEVSGQRGVITAVTLR